MIATFWLWEAVPVCVGLGVWLLLLAAAVMFVNIVILGRRAP